MNWLDAPTHQRRVRREGDVHAQDTKLIQRRFRGPAVLALCVHDDIVERDAGVADIRLGGVAESTSGALQHATWKYPRDILALIDGDLAVHDDVLHSH